MGKGARNRAKRDGVKDTLGYRDMKREVLREVNKQLAAAQERFIRDEVAIILWTLHTMEKDPWGKKRLKEFYDKYSVNLNKLKEHYEASDNDLKYIAHDQLKRIGVDLDEWEAEE